MIAQTTLASLLDASPLPQLLVGPDERVVAMNVSARSLFAETIVGRHYITGLRQPAILDSVERVLASGKADSTTFLATESMRDVAYKVSVGPVAFGDLGGALITLEDRTELEEVGKIRQDFVANVSHELRTPLTALIGFIETLRGAARDDPKAQNRFLGMMEGEARRMDRLIHDLLSLSRVESEERTRPTGTVELDGILRSVAASLQQYAQERGASISLLGLDTTVRVPGDPDQLLQVFTNLVENAVKYGGGEIEISLSRSDREPALRGPAVRVAVTDRGEGVDAIHIPRLTERFYRVDTHRSREMGGTGLGLAIVKHIVSRHRGRLRIESARGKGSTFTVILPSTTGPANGGSANTEGGRD